MAFAPIAELALMQPIVRAVGRAHRDLRLDVHTCSEIDALRAVHAGTLHAAHQLGMARHEAPLEECAPTSVLVLEGE
jgi:hypothetical protein